MYRALILAAALAAQSAFAIFGIETDPAKIDAQWMKEKLEAVANDRDPKERAGAAEWLGGRNSPEAIAALAKALSDRDAKVRQAAAGGLWKAEKAAEPARSQLAKLGAGAGPAHRNEAARAVANRVDRDGLLFAGHTLGMPWRQEHTPRGTALVEEMKAYRFDVMGFTRGYWDFYVGFGFTIAVSLLAFSILLWHLDGLAKTAPDAARPMIAVLLLTLAAFSALDARYFFTAPLVLTVPIAVSLAWAWLAST